MPIDGILDLQRRSVQIGEIRIGTSVAVPGKTYRKPVRLETFRFTTASEQTANAVAAKSGGTVAPWSQRKGRWEVTTDRTALDVWVPPRGGAVDANMEMWDGPRCLRRCNGITERISGQPCLCPYPDDPSDPVSVQGARDERKRLAALRPPQACKPLTRINVTIPDLPGLTGVFRLNTGSENAAVETADSGDAMEIAREGGVYLPAVLRIEWRVRAADGKPYPVPVLQIGLSMREIAAGTLPAGPSGLLAQLQGAAPGEQRRAITTGTVAAPTPDPAPDEPVFDHMTPEQQAQSIADAAAKATTRAQIRDLKTMAEAHSLTAIMINPPGSSDLYEELDSYLHGRWEELPAAGAA